MEARRRTRLEWPQNEVREPAGAFKYPGYNAYCPLTGDEANIESKQQKQGADKKPFSEGIKYKREEVCQIGRASCRERVF